MASTPPSSFLRKQESIRLLFPPSAQTNHGQQDVTLSVAEAGLGSHPSSFLDPSSVLGGRRTIRPLFPPSTQTNHG
ncbi:MAG: hypothetical protein OXR07_02315, partial [Nitrospira sp.]|nr:hypothetical protein [Nitrospira sp.]